MRLSGVLHRVFWEVLITDMRLQSFVSRLDRLLKRLDMNGFAWKFLMMRLPESYIKYPIQDKKLETEFRDMLSRVLVKHQGYKAGALASAANVLKRQLEQKRNLAVTQARETPD